MIHNLRKIVLINIRFQLSLVFKIAILMLIIDFIFYGANLYFFNHIRDQAMLAGLSSENSFYKYIYAQKAYMDQVFFISALISTVTAIWGGLYISHRVAGPLHRLVNHLRTSTMSNVEPVQFRKNDYFPEVQAAFNEFIGTK
jgi:hypothetical protein